MIEDKWGIWVEGINEEGMWMKDGWFQDMSGDWIAEPALFDTPCEANAEAKLFNKDSKYNYSAKKYEENP